MLGVGGSMSFCLYFGLRVLGIRVVLFVLVSYTRDEGLGFLMVWWCLR